jgi:hypothetical protein
MKNPIPTETTTRRRLIALQGWTGEDVSKVERAGIGSVVGPAVCLTGTVVATVFVLPWLFAALVAVSLVGVFTSNHPAEMLYNAWARKTGRGQMPATRAARRSACLLAAVWLGSAGVAFAVGATTAGYVLAISIIPAMAAMTFAGFCIPSYLFQSILGPGQASKRDLFGSVDTVENRKAQTGENRLSDTSVMI